MGRTFAPDYQPAPLPYGYDALEPQSSEQVRRWTAPAPRGQLRQVRPVEYIYTPVDAIHDRGNTVTAQKIMLFSYVLVVIAAVLGILLSLLV